jgi:hypothetical protein
VDNDDVTLLGVFYNPAATPIPIPKTDTVGTATPEPATIVLITSGLLLVFAFWLTGPKERIS